MAIKIITDSTSDIPFDSQAELEIEIVPLSVHFGEKEYIDGVSLTKPQFFKMLRECVFAWNGNIKEPEVVSINGDSMQFKVKLHPRESMIIAVDPKQRPVVKVPEKQASILRTVELNKGWQIQNPPVNMETADELESWTDFPEMENFSGTLTYTNKFELKALSTGNSIQLDLGEVCELARVFVNEREVGVKLMAPYTFDLTEYVKEGNNIIAVDVTNTLANKYTNAQLKSGLIGPVKVVVKTFR